ncbi:MAG: Bax inhibitor-1/YccA family protein [Alphaproteobacteria bacterium]|nr:Bax inhibitor-1/YccA family protein [Alphaproteobacteria bacterium]
MTDPFFRSGVAGLDRVTMDAGLRAHMQRVFGYMGVGLALTGLMAWVTAHTVLAQIIFGSPLRWLVALAPLGFIMAMNFKMNTISVSGLKTLFWIFCGVMGLSMGAIFLTYNEASIARAFFVTAATFGAMSLWGYTTKSDLSGMGSFLLMGVFGIIIASLVNLFMLSTMLQWMVSVAGVAIFTGLTAWDVQRIKQSYAESYGTEANDKMAVFGALSLYLNFINAFQFVLALMGGRRD